MAMLREPAAAAAAAAAAEAACAIGRTASTCLAAWVPEQLWRVAGWLARVMWGLKPCRTSLQGRAALCSGSSRHLRAPVQLLLEPMRRPLSGLVLCQALQSIDESEKFVLHAQLQAAGVAWRGRAVHSRGPESVGRLAIEGLGGAAWRLGQAEPGAAVLRALLQLKRALGSSRCAAIVSVPAGVQAASAY